MDNPSPAQFNAMIIEEFRASGGRVRGDLAHTPLILVHHVGAKSGLERVVPLVYLPWPDGRFMIIASNGGSSVHPAWYHNLKENPRITVEVGTESFQVLAAELNAATRAEIWPRLVEQSPAAGEFQRTTTRTFPVFVLTRDDSRPAEDRCDTCC